MIKLKVGIFWNNASFREICPHCGMDHEPAPGPCLCLAVELDTPRRVDIDIGQTLCPECSERALPGFNAFHMEWMKSEFPEHFTEPIEEGATPTSASE